MKTSTSLFFSALLATSLVPASVASLRCDNGLASKGDTILEVEMKCGKPANSSIINPSVDEFGNRVQGAATIENWVYGPQNGMYRYLRFVEGTLVEIDSKRN